MNKFINELLEKHLGHLIDESRDKITLADSTCIQNEIELSKLGEQYRALNLTKDDRKIIDVYIDYRDKTDHRIADMSYIAGVRDTVKLLNSLDLIREMEEEEPEP